MLEGKATRITLGTATWLNLPMFLIRRTELFLNFLRRQPSLKLQCLDSSLSKNYLNLT